MLAKKMRKFWDTRDALKEDLNPLGHFALADEEMEEAVQRA